MSTQQTLDRLVNEFDSWKCSKHESCSQYELNRQARAKVLRDSFVRRYPYIERPRDIANLTAKSLYDPGPGREYFLRGIVWTLRSLGGIGIRDMTPFQEALNYVPQIRQILPISLNPGLEIAERIDAPWHSVPGFGHGDRVVVKKIVATYFPNEAMPIFNQSDMEHFVRHLRRENDREGLARQRYATRYRDLSCGQKFSVTNHTLLECKKDHPVLAAESPEYFMYCLYAGSARPKRMKEWRGHNGSTFTSIPGQRPPAINGKTGRTPVDDQYELETGIMQGDRYHNSKAARKAIELRAMELAERHYRQQGWSVDNVSKNRPYDLECRRGDEVLRVEVKGTTANGSTVLLTRNEVTNAREFPSVALFIVRGIEVVESEGKPVARGGQHREWKPWQIDEGVLDCFQYEYCPPMSPTLVV